MRESGAQKKVEEERRACLAEKTKEIELEIQLAFRIQAILVLLPHLHVVKKTLERQEKMSWVRSEMSGELMTAVREDAELKTKVQLFLQCRQCLFASTSAFAFEKGVGGYSRSRSQMMVIEGQHCFGVGGKLFPETVPYAMHSVPRVSRSHRQHLDCPKKAADQQTGKLMLIQKVQLHQRQEHPIFVSDVETTAAVVDAVDIFPVRSPMWKQVRAQSDATAAHCQMLQRRI